MTHILYVTRPADRLDLIAYRHYGDQDRIAPILAANPQLTRSAIPGVLAAGVALVIPVLAEPPSAADSLPPWKRST